MGTEKYSFERFLNVRTAYNPTFSPDGQRLSFLTDITGVAEVWSVSVNMQTSRPAWPEQLTFRGERSANVIYSPKADLLLVTGDVGGNERNQLFLLSVDGSTFKPLTNRPDVVHLNGSWSPDGMRIVYSCNARDSRFFDVYELTLKTGETRPLLSSDDTNYALGYSPDGRYILVARMLSNTRNQLFLVETATGNARNLTPDLPEGPALHGMVSWSADRHGLYLLSNRGRQFLSLAYLDLETTGLTYLYDLAWDIEQLVVTRDGTSMAVVINEDGYSRLQLFDVSEGWQGRRELNQPVLPAGVIPGLSWSQDGGRLAITFGSSVDPFDIWIWDARHGVIQRATQSSLGGIARATFVMPSLIHYPTFDGRQIPAFLYLPHGQHGPQKNLPIVIDVHGGPEGQVRPLFNPITQYLVSCGYGVLAPNVRGSSGYGIEYQSLDDVRLRMDSVADLQHAVFWLCQSGVADPQRIAVMGGSYGGFMVLSSITTYPDLWAAAVDIVGIANFVTFLENTGPWRRKLREAEYGSLENDREFLEQISPIHHVECITAPLFVVHGANDPRVPVGEAEQIVSALRQRHVPVEYLRFEDEGHGLVKRVNRLIAYPSIARFLDEHLGSAS